MKYQQRDNASVARIKDLVHMGHTTKMIVEQLNAEKAPLPPGFTATAWSEDIVKSIRRSRKIAAPRNRMAAYCSHLLEESRKEREQQIAAGTYVAPRKIDTLSRPPPGSYQLTAVDAEIKELLHGVVHP
jgi:hypothetical protein